MTAIRVTLFDLPAPYNTFNGETMWVGPPREICENSGQNELVPIAECGPAIGRDPSQPGPTLFVARLRCEPFFMDWTTIPKPVNVTSEFIVPRGSYSIQAIHAACSIANEPSFSFPMSMTNSIWGDVVGLTCLTVDRCSLPDGNIGITGDVAIVLEMYKNSQFAPGKARADVEPSRLDFKINFLDVLRVLEAFQGMRYPFVPSTTNPCP